MKIQGVIEKFDSYVREQYPVLLLSLAAIVLSSMDQCTRGPSITAMVLANLDRIF